MKKKLALLLAGVMVVGMIPMTAFAATTNRISRVVTGDDDTTLGQFKNDPADNLANVPVLRIYDKDLKEIVKDESTSKQAFQLDLTNAEWNFEDTIGKLGGDDTDITNFVKGLADVKVTQLSAKSVIIEGYVDESYTVDDEAAIGVLMLTDLTDEGDATVTIDPMESILSSGTYKFATVAGGSTTVSVEKKKSVSENGATLKNIVIKETSPGSLSKGDMKFKLSSDWSFSFNPEKTKLSVYPSEYADNIKIDYADDDDKEQLIVKVTPNKGDKFESDTAITLSLSAWVVYDDDEVEPGETCTMTVSGAGVDRTTLDVATAVTYGVTWEAEDKTLPVFYSGRADKDQDTLKVHLEETVKASWLSSRKTKIVFPEGVRVLGIETSDYKKIDSDKIRFTLNDDANEITVRFDDEDDDKSAVDVSTTSEMDFQFQLSIAPSFTGDITATLTGSGVEDTIEAVVGVAVAPVTVEAVKSDLILDYRRTAAGDITITEAEPGLLEKNKTLVLKMENISFDDDPTVEVVSGDLKLGKVTTDGGLLKIKVDSESAKEPAVIKVSNVNLYMQRSIPAGDYALKLTADGTTTFSDGESRAKDWDNDANGDQSFSFDSDKEANNAIFQNSVTSGSTYDHTPYFDSRNLTVYPDYVRVVTAGRDVDDSTFTTKLTVTIGATSMTAGDKTIALDVPAYISNGYTMLPVRAVTEALSGAAIVRWDDPTHTVTITFGARVVNMTVGSNIMVINGVDVPMQAKCEITNSRAFIPLRDMGYALGLNDSKIQWDDTTKTATLN